MNAQVIEEVVLNPQRRLWTVEEFERAGELGLFGPDERLELIEGEIIQKVAPQLTAHASALLFVDNVLRDVVGPGYYLRIQLPLRLGPTSEPEPDVAVIAGKVRDALKGHPSTAALIVEIADSSLRLDRHAKASLYARANVQEYWIVNLQDKVLEIHRDPTAMEDEPYGYHYRSITRHTPEQSVSPLIAADHAIKVADLLP
jgi:Uma2 family endonuclease